MKINFEGTAEEFRLVFSGAILFEEEEDFEDSGPRVRSFPVVRGGKKEEPSTEEEEEDEDEDPLEEEEEEGDDGMPLVASGMPTLNPTRDEMPVPLNDRVHKKQKLPSLKPEVREAAWGAFRKVCVLWIENFGATEEVEVTQMQALRDEEGNFVDEEGNLIPKGAKVCYEAVKAKVVQPAKQPDRLAALSDLGAGQHTIAVLIMAYEMGSLQLMVGKALLEHTETPLLGLSSSESYFDYIDQIAANMVQVSHMAFPDLAGTYDYSTKWRRSSYAV